MRTWLSAGLICVTALVSCDSTGPEVEPADRLVVLTANHTAEETGTRLPLSVRAIAMNGHGAVAGATVRWTVEAGTGSVDPTSVVTGSDGMATTELVVGSGENRILATVDGRGARTLLFIHGCSGCGEWLEVSYSGRGRAWASAAVVGQEIWLMGGVDQTRVTDSIAMFEPGRAVWRADGPSLPAPAIGTVGVTVDGSVYVIGGTQSDFYGLVGDNRVRSWHSGTGTWEERAPLPMGRFFAAGAALDGKVYVAGGYAHCEYFGWCPGPAVSSLDVYDPASDRWTTGPPMKRVLAMAGAAVLDGKMYVAGGVTDEYLWLGNPPAIMEVYDPSTGQWRTLAEPPFAGPVHLIAHHGELYAVETAILLEKRQQSRLFVYGVDTDEWERLRDLPVALLGSAVVGFGDRLYAIGGYTNASEVPYSRVLSRTVYELRR